MSQTTIAPVRYSVTVPIPAAQAFTLFTEGFNTWWIGHHIGQADLAEAVLEPREGGRWYERDVDGGECDWGTVLRFQPPERIDVTWQINSRLQYDPDRARASEVEVLLRIPSESVHLFRSIPYTGSGVFVQVAGRL
jgi:hypothetical protein